MEYDILIEDYIEGLYLNEGLEHLDESFKEFLNKLTPPKIKQMLSKTYEKAAAKDIEGFMNLAKKFGLKTNQIKSKDLSNIAKQLPEEIQMGAKLCGRVIKNSIPKASKSSVNAASYFVAILSKYKAQKTKNYMGILKTEIKDYIGKVQQFYEEAEEKTAQSGKRVLPEDMADMAMAIGTIVALSAVSVIVIVSLTVLLKYLIIFAIIACAVVLLDWELFILMGGGMGGN